ncbi:MAG: hypothetical protein RLY58_1883 [Pseudomonadota bacterium]
MWFWILLIGMGVIIMVIIRRPRSTTGSRSSGGDGSHMDHRASPTPDADTATSFLAATALHQGLAHADQAANESCGGESSNDNTSGDSGCGGGGDSGGGD